MSLLRLVMVSLLAGCGGLVEPLTSDADGAGAAAGTPVSDASPGEDAGARPGTTADAGGGAMDASVAAPDAGPMTNCRGVVGSRNRALSVVHGGLTRTFSVHLPPRYDGRTPAPVVLNFHGRNSTATQQELLSGMNAFADGKGFIAVHPDGVGNTWNAGLCCGEAQTRNIDDVGFTAAMLDTLNAELCVDARRVYATGLSNGGFMAHRLACELSDRITAVAPVAGPNGSPTCQVRRAVPVFHFHGTGDLVVPYDGYAGVLSVPGTMSGWVSRDGCSANKTVYFRQGDVSCDEWAGCRDGATVRLCTVANGGHQWPGGFTIPGLGPNTSDLSATAAMWTFFQRHSL